MSSTTKSFILATVILAVVTFGVLSMEGSDAADGDYTVTVTADGASLPYTAIGGVIEMPSEEDVAAFYSVPEGWQLTGWKDVSTGAIYTPGQTYTITKDITVEPYLTIDGYAVVFIVGDDRVTVPVSDEPSSKVTVTEEVEDLIAAVEGQGFRFGGWLAQGSDEVMTTEQVEGADVTSNITYTAQFAPIYDVVWIVDGTVIATGNTVDALNVPADPVKQHYAFAGWYDADGVRFTTDDPETEKDEGYAFTGNTIFTAKFDPEMLTVTFVAGETTVATVTVPYGQTVVMPSLPEGFKAWDFDFATPITENITIAAVEADPVPDDPDTGIYTVQFVVDGQVIATYSSNAVTVPADPVKEGYAFSGWAIGDSVIADPSTYAYTADTVLTALFRAVEVVEHTVVFYVDADTHYTVQVVDGETVTAPEAPEGMQWDPAIDLTAPVTADMTVDAVPLKVTVQFAVDGTVVAILTQVIDYGGTVDTALLSSYTFPAGYDGWDADLTMQVYADTVISAKEIVKAEEHKFTDNPVNVIAITVLILVVIVALVWIYILRRDGRLPKQLSFLSKKTKTDTKTMTVKADEQPVSETKGGKTE